MQNLKSYTTLRKLKKRLYPVLFFLSLIYQGVLGIFKLFRFFKPVKVGCKVISIGNITLGGTGKTPMVINIVRDLKKKLVVVSRGYRSIFERKNFVVDEQTSSVDAIGEEAFLIFRNTNVPVIIGRDRVRSCRIAINKYKPDVIVLDDGFQYQRLHKDFDLVCLDALVPIWRCDFFPLGDLREGLGSLFRADLILLTRVNLLDVQEKADWNNFLDDKFKQIPVVEVSIFPEYYVDLYTDEKLDKDYFSGKFVYLLSCIGNPDSFERLVKKMGGRVLKHFAFIDHYTLSDKDFMDIHRWRGGYPLITTEKDAIKLKRYSGVYWLKVRYEITKNRHLWEEFIGSI